MQLWWERWPGRREAEIDSFRRHGLAFIQDDNAFEAGRLVLRGSIVMGDQEIHLDVVYPDSYPWTRFSVAAPGLDLPRHQHPFGKNLCVFPRASEHWDRRWLAGDVVRERVPELIGAVRRGGEYLQQAEDPQGEPYTDYYNFWPNGGVLVPTEILDAARGVDGGSFSLRMNQSGDWLETIVLGSEVGKLGVGNGVVVSLTRGQATLARAPEALTRFLTGPTWTGRWVRLHEPPNTSDPSVFASMVARQHPRLQRMNFANGSRTNVELIGVVFEEEVVQGERGDAWVFVAAAKPKGGSGKRSRRAPGQQPPAVALVRGMRAGVDHLGERIPELSPLRDVNVSVIGLGTLGSPLAKEMARNLVRELHVVDPDFVDAGTAVRWERGFGLAGTAKPIALVDDLTRNYPYTSVIGHHAAIGATLEGAGDGDRELFEQVIEGSDLVIDATAEDNVTAAIVDSAWDAHVPVVALWSIEGFGGVVVRIVPGETGCYHCLELHLSERSGTVPVPAPPHKSRRVQPRGCADPTFTSPAPDLLPLVDHASRMAFGELCKGYDDGYPRYPSDLYVFWLRQPDGALYDPPRWESHQLTVHPDCPCHDEPLS